ncbi:MAG: 4-hydroxythreonine-4-phosphate dehydrogenase PdxA [Proteobacteria bacterium]|nr:4-hydroxythreonine-4-phosphate dehydrogenase PdxA [Pseudomonadota bacterium]
MTMPPNTETFVDILSQPPQSRFKRIAIAPGDPAGIGYEITVQALAEPSIRQLLARTIVVVYAHAGLWQRAVELFAPSLTTSRVLSAENALEPGQIYLVDPGVFIDMHRFVPGQMDAACASCAHQALMQIVRDVQNHWIDGICTGPIHKGAMRLAAVKAIGHTEMLAEAFGADNPMTLFITRNLRIFFYSRHLSLKQAIEALDTSKIIDFAVHMHTQMKQLGFETPHLAMAALNPHASDGGQFGNEEADILTPAAECIRALGIDITNPIGADSVFAQAAAGQFDAVLSLYHDQGHIAAKTYDFERTISATLGLPCLRTSVDHGTAFDIAWKGLAQTISMQTAIENLMRYI